MLCYHVILSVSIAKQSKQFVVGKLNFWCIVLILPAYRGLVRLHGQVRGGGRLGVGRTPGEPRWSPVRGMVVREGGLKS